MYRRFPILLLLAPRLLAAQTTPEGDSGVRPAWVDSLAINRQAYKSQRDFESVRRALLPNDKGGGGRQACDNVIGRFCYWYDPRAGESRPEPPYVTQERLRLIAKLGAAADRLPGDAWIAGQRVRYMVEAGQTDSALAAARACRVRGWWCTALEAFALHSAGQYLAADSAFARTLRAMPLADRCIWTDLSRFIDDGQAYLTWGCVERESLNAWIWWLSQPLLTRPGNDLRTEHYSRRVLVALLERASDPHGLSWNWDNEELLVRFGYPRGWSKQDGPLIAGGTSVIGHEPVPSYWFFPRPALAGHQSADLSRVRWELDRPRPRMRYAPAYGQAFTTIARAQVARFPRGDSLVSVAAFDLEGDTTFRERPPVVALAAGQDPFTPIASTALPPARAGVVMVATPWRARILSLEAVDSVGRRVARLRAGLSPMAEAGRLGISDVLLFEPVEELPERLADAAPRALHSPILTEGAKVGLYWEATVPGATGAATVQVRVVRLKDDKAPPAPIGRSECAPPGETPIALRFDEPAEAGPRGRARSFILDLGKLQRGRYAIGVSVSHDGASACTIREIAIVTADRK
ncbi:MAG: hypothetical protein ACOY71_10750 [Gemmatimonadota bacterium]